MGNLRIELKPKKNIKVLIVKKDKIVSYDITTDNNKFYTLKKKRIY